MAERLAGGNVAIALPANAIATGGVLVAIILAFGPISGAHLNPAVTLADAWQHGVASRDVPVYIVAQLVGAIVGVATANVMFGLPPLLASHHARAGSAVVGRIRRDLRAARRHLGLRSSPLRVDAVCRCGLGRLWESSVFGD